MKKLFGKLLCMVGIHKMPKKLLVADTRWFYVEYYVCERCANIQTYYACRSVDKRRK